MGFLNHEIPETCEKIEDRRIMAAKEPSAAKPQPKRSQKELFRAESQRPQR